MCFPMARTGFPIPDILIVFQAFSVNLAFIIILFLKVFVPTFVSDVSDAGKSVFGSTNSAE